MKTKLRDKIFLRWLPLILMNLFVLFPIVWAVITSLKREGDILKKPIRYIPDPATIENYIRAWVNCNFSRYFGNSMKIAVVSVSCIVIIAIMVGYALSRYRFKGRNLFMLMLLEKNNGEDHVANYLHSLLKDCLLDLHLTIITLMPYTKEFLLADIQR